MARIAGVDLPREKRVEVALNYIFGVGPSRSKDILAATGINPDTRVKNLTESEQTKLRDAVEKTYKVEGDLRSEIGQNVKRLMDIGSYAPAPTRGPAKVRRRRWLVRRRRRGSNGETSQRQSDQAQASQYWFW
jgi:small subunit ribosomal protein S13